NPGAIFPIGRGWRGNGSPIPDKGARPNPNSPGPWKRGHNVGGNPGVDSWFRAGPRWFLSKWVGEANLTNGCLEKKAFPGMITNERRSHAAFGLFLPFTFLGRV